MPIDSSGSVKPRTVISSRSVRSLPNADFVDFTHLGAAGRRRYSEQLVPLLRGLLHASAPG